jgi:hypothetical protein
MTMLQSKASRERFSFVVRLAARTGRLNLRMVALDFAGDKEMEASWRNKHSFALISFTRPNEVKARSVCYAAQVNVQASVPQETNLVFVSDAGLPDPQARVSHWAFELF